MGGNALPDKYFDDREVVLAAVSSAPWVLSFMKHNPAAARLYEDREVMLTAVRCDGTLLHFASDELRGDLEVVGAAARQAGCDKVVPLASPAFRQALERDCSLLQHCPATVDIEDRGRD